MNMDLVRTVELSKFFIKFDLTIWYQVVSSVAMRSVT